MRDAPVGAIDAWRVSSRGRGRTHVDATGEIEGAGAISPNRTASSGAKEQERVRGAEAPRALSGPASAPANPSTNARRLSASLAGRAGG